MSFVTTWIAVAGLVSMVVPILIHLLLRRRREPVEWGAMRLLVEALKRHRRRARIERILLLAVRCLALVLAALAIAEPLLSALGSLGGGSRLVVLLVDDGIVSGVIGSSGSPDLARSVDSARRVIDELDPGDRVALISMAHPPRSITDGPTINLEGVSRMLDDLEPGSSRTNIEDSITMARELVDRHGSGSTTSVVLLGSWRRGSLSSILDGPVVGGFDEPSEHPLSFLANEPTDEVLTVIAVSDVSMRRTIESTDTERPQVRTSVSVRRMGGELGESRSLVRLEGPGLEATLPRQIEWYPGRTEATIEFLGRASADGAAADGSSIVTASIEDGTLPEATRRSTVVDTSGAVQVRIIDRRLFSSSGSLDEIEVSDWVARALAPVDGGGVDVDWIDPASLSESSLRGVDGIIVSRPDLVTGRGWETIREFTITGGLLFLIPPSDLDSHVWIDDMSEAIDLEWNFDVGVTVPDESMALADRQEGGSIISFLDNEIDQLSAPVEIHRIIEIDVGEGNGRTLLRCEDESPFLICWEPDGDRNGTIIMIAAPPHLEWTNLPIKPLMVPLMQEIIREGVTAGRVSSQLLSGDVPPGSLSGIREITGPGGLSVSIGNDRTFLDPINRTGHWVARDTSGSALTTIVVNPDIEASNPETTSTEMVMERFGDESGLRVVDDDSLVGGFTEQESNPLWSILLLLAALILLVFETVMNRSFSRSVVRSGPRYEIRETSS